MGKNLEAEACEFAIVSQSYIGDLYIRIKEALSKSDAIMFYKLCNELGITPDDKDNLLYERGQLESEGRELNISKKRYFGRERVPKQVYQELIKQAGIVRVRPWNILEDIEQKRKLLREVMGYEQLKTNFGYASIDECDDSRIGQSFVKVYKIACRAIGLTH